MINVRDFGAVGDGIADDTRSIQAAFDSGNEIFIPNGNYKITKTLYVSSNTSIHAHEEARLFMCGNTPKKRNDFLISNSDTLKGNCNIKIDGGIWDGNNQGRYNTKPDLFDKNGYSGTVMNFVNVEGLYLYNFTVANSVTYNIRMCKLKNFEIKNICFFSENLAFNQDGLHFGGEVHNGVIDNIKAVSNGQTNDDFIALNADDSLERVENFDLVCGEISNIKISNIWAENCFTFVRMCSVTSPIHDIEIKNVSGGCRNYALNLDAARYCRTPLFTDKNSHVGIIHDVLIENMEVDWSENSPEKAMIVIESNVDNFTLKNVRRKIFNNNKPTIEFAYVDDLKIRDNIKNVDEVISLSQNDAYSRDELCFDWSITKL